MQHSVNILYYLDVMCSILNGVQCHSAYASKANNQTQSKTVPKQICDVCINDVLGDQNVQTLEMRELILDTLFTVIYCVSLCYKYPCYVVWYPGIFVIPSI